MPPPNVQRVSIVTGAGSGIGRAVAEALSAAGHRIALIGRGRPALEATGARLVTEWIALPADVADPAAMGAAIAATEARFGRIDVLINNAGLAPMHPIPAHTPEIIRRTIDVNLVAPAVAIAAVWPSLVRSGGGRIVNVSSMASIDPFPGFFAYAAAKAGVNMLAQCAAQEGRDAGILAFAVAPGAVETPMLRALFNKEALPRAQVLDPAEVARVIVDCATGRRDGEAGTTIRVERR